jgi:hypothetical protein
MTTLAAEWKGQRDRIFVPPAIWHHDDAVQRAILETNHRKINLILRNIYPY